MRKRRYMTGFSRYDPPTGKASGDEATLPPQATTKQVVLVAVFC